jgi:hypothetical protein
MSKLVLEPAAEETADATSRPPFLHELGPDGARKVLDLIQAAPIDKLDVDEKWITVRAEVGDVRVCIVKPVGAAGALKTAVANGALAGGLRRGEGLQHCGPLLVEMRRASRASMRRRSAILTALIAPDRGSDPHRPPRRIPHGRHRGR